MSESTDDRNQGEGGTPPSRESRPERREGSGAPREGGAPRMGGGSGPRGGGREGGGGGYRGGGGGGGGGYRGGGGGGRDGGRGGGRDGGRDGGRGGPRGGRRFHRGKLCSYTVEQVNYIDFKDIERLRAYLADSGKILPRRVTGASSRHQRMIATAIKRARHMALLPYKSR